VRRVDELLVLVRRGDFKELSILLSDSSVAGRQVEDVTGPEGLLAIGVLDLETALYYVAPVWTWA
jgi:hypothetical protein